MSSVKAIKQRHFQVNLSGKPVFLNVSQTACILEIESEFSELETQVTHNIT